MTQNNTYTANVVSIESNGDAILELPQELCDRMGWKEGTKIDISKNGNGEIVLKEIKYSVV
jgi:bifunctional DNA-binding transcriptional regulator/antitoxin component of YhaV-PrlF toxin-antitoxin module